MKGLENYMKEFPESELIIGETVLGNFYIRPQNWSGVYNNSKLVCGDCLEYFKTREKAEQELIRLRYEINI